MSTQSIELDQIPPCVVSPRSTYLMCPPHLYDVAYIINPWMNGNLHATSREHAVAQWHRLHDALSKIADVKLIEPQPGSPDMVFTANAGLEHNGIVVLSSFFHPERQAEELYFRQWFQHSGYAVLEMPRTTPFEGEGDALFSLDGCYLWAGYGPRTVLESHKLLANAWKTRVISLHLIDSRFYHLDTCFAPLVNGYVMYYPAAFDAKSIASIEAFYPTDKRIIVSEADAIRFACNAINVDRTILFNEISAELLERLAAANFNVVPIALGEFLKAGGAAKCLVMKLSPQSQY